MKSPRVLVCMLLMAISTVFGMADAAEPNTDGYLNDLKGARFTCDPQGVISDHREGLQWVEKNDVNVINWYDSQKWIRSLGGAWRFPSREELATLYVEGAGGGGSKNMDPVFKTYGKHFWTGEKARVSELFNPFGKKGAYYINFEVKGSAQGIEELKSGSIGYAAVLAVRETK